MAKRKQLELIQFELAKQAVKQYTGLVDESIVKQMDKSFGITSTYLPIHKDMDNLRKQQKSITSKITMLKHSDSQYDAKIKRYDNISKSLKREEGMLETKLKLTLAEYGTLFKASEVDNNIISKTFLANDADFNSDDVKMVN